MKEVVPDEFTTTEAADFLNLSPTMVIKLIHSGRLRSRVEEERRGKLYLITRKALEEYKVEWEQEKKARDERRKERELNGRRR